MSESGGSQASALNWRGPLLASAVFAAAFAVLLVMAHQNQSNTSDAGSSLRQDPYGTSLVFDSYERAGYQVERSQDEDSLADRDVSRTTAFFIAGSGLWLWDSGGDIETRDGTIITGGKFHALLKSFLERGGRAVLIEHDAGVSVAPVVDSGPGETPKPPKWHNEQSWGIESNFHRAGQNKPAPAWARPDPRAMPSGSEMMYLAADVPWLKADANWTDLYSLPASGSDEAKKRKAADPPIRRVYMAMRRVGKGELIAASQQSFVLNEAIKTHPNPVLLDFLAGGRREIWVDETLHGLHQDQGVLWLVARYRLQAALLLFWGTLLALLWSLSGDLIRRPARDRRADVIRQGEPAGVAAQRLLRRSMAAEQVAAECWDQFRRRSPQDAQAISADPQWGLRLRTALGQSPLDGYAELARLIAERRAAAKGLARSQPHAAPPFAAPKKIFKETQIA